MPTEPITVVVNTPSSQIVKKSDDNVFTGTNTFQDINAQYISGKKVGIYAFLSAPADTTITTAGTYYPVLGTFTNSPIESFSAAAVYTPGIKYDGTLTQYFEIDWHTTIFANAPMTTVTFAIFKNGTLIGGSDMSQLCKTASYLYSLSGTCVVELATDDEIQLVITSDGE